MSSSPCGFTRSALVGLTASSPRRPAPSSRSVRLAASPRHDDRRDSFDLVRPDVVADDQLPTGLRGKIGAVAPSAAALTALAALSIPAASNAVTLADVSSIAGGASASYSSFVEGLTDSGFYQAFSLVFLSEIGDKTFFVAALLAAKLLQRQASELACAGAPT